MSNAHKIPQEHPFINREIILNFSNGVVETLRTMADAESSFDKPFVEKNWKSPSEVSVILDLQSPPYTGQLRFHFNRIALSKLYHKMLDQEISPDSPEVLDCLGEISNMCYGYAKGKLNEAGFSLKMSLPKPDNTKDLPKAYSLHPHIVIPFIVFNEKCFIEIIIY